MVLLALFTVYGKLYTYSALLLPSLCSYCGSSLSITSGSFALALSHCSPGQLRVSLSSIPLFLLYLRLADPLCRKPEASMTDLQTICNQSTSDLSSHVDRWKIEDAPHLHRSLIDYEGATIWQGSSTRRKRQRFMLRGQNRSFFLFG